MHFIRVHGRVIPIRDENQVSVSKAGAVGAAAGAAYHVRDAVAKRSLDKLAPNVKHLSKFKVHLKAGDIVVLGSTPKNSGGHELVDVLSSLPKQAHKAITKAAKAVGIRKNTVLLSNSSILTAVGAGNKYHAGIYLGGGRVAHMTTDAGATVEKLKDMAKGQNITAMRFHNATKAETNAAVNFAKAAAKAKAPYAQSSGVASAVSNLILPVGKKAEKGISGMVCHTLAVRAYGKRAFKLGEHTFAGDFIKTPGLAAVARRDVVKSSLTTFKALAGSSVKGLKWGVGAALGATAVNYALRHKREEKA